MKSRILAPWLEDQALQIDNLAPFGGCIRLPQSVVDPSCRTSLPGVPSQGRFASCCPRKQRTQRGGRQENRIRAMTDPLSTRSSMRANEYLLEAPPGTSKEGKRGTYA